VTAEFSQLAKTVPSKSISASTAVNASADTTRGHIKFLRLYIDALSYLARVKNRTVIKVGEHFNSNQSTIAIVSHRNHDSIEECF